MTNRSTAAGGWRGRCYVLVLLAGLWAAIYVHPVSTGVFRTLMLAASVAVVGWAVHVIWPVRWLRYSVIALLAGCVTFALLPARQIDQNELRAHYISRLKSYEDAPYAWGGENEFGMDCSGLVRKAFIEANVTYSLTRLESSTLRRAISLWWHDASAASLGEGYRDETRPLLTAKTLRHTDHAALAPGDIAITEHGLHALVYLGDKTWIQADPNPTHGRVVILPLSDPTNWHNVPVTILRWSGL